MSLCQEIVEGSVCVFLSVFRDPHSLSLNAKQILAAMYQVESIISLYPSACLSEKIQSPEGETEKRGTSQSFRTVQPWTALWDKNAVSPY